MRGWHAIIIVNKLRNTIISTYATLTVPLYKTTIEQQLYRLYSIETQTSLSLMNEARLI